MIHSDKESNPHKDLSTTSIYTPKDIVLLLVKLIGSTQRSGECFNKRFSFFLAHDRDSGGRGQ